MKHIHFERGSHLMMNYRYSYNGEAFRCVSIVQKKNTKSPDQRN